MKKIKFRLPWVVAKDTAEKKPRVINILQRNIISMASQLPVYDEWLDQDEIDKIDEDASVISAVSLRKSATLKKELIISCDDEEVGKELKRRLGFTFRQQALDTPLQGFGVFELIWDKVGSLYCPKPIERNYQDFTFRGADLYYTPDDIKVPDLKTITAIYAPKFNKPMGRPLYKTLFWLVKFKNASVDFWLEYMERFSSPWIVGTTSGDKDEMAENLYAMLSGDVAVIEDDDKVDLKTPENKGNFYELAKYADDQIRGTLLGGNLLGADTGGSFAASKEQNKVREDVAMIDEHILSSLIEQMLEAFRKANLYTKELSYELKDEKGDYNERADRDLKIHQMSGEKMRPTKEYLEETYKIDLEDVPTGDVMANSLIAGKDKVGGEKDYIGTQLPPGVQLAKLDSEILQQIEHIFADANSFEEAIEMLVNQYETFDSKSAEELLSNYIANSHLFGAAEVEDENPKG